MPLRNLPALVSRSLALLCSIAPVGAVTPIVDAPASANAPASEGRVITPAGELIRDARSHEPAVGSLPG